MSEENTYEDHIIGSVDLTSIANPEQIISANLELESYRKSVFSINDFPPYLPECENPDILIKGRWLERGGSAWWISTAGTGKSIASVQIAYKWGAGLDFAGLQPHRNIRTWIIQSEDSPSRVTIDREDIVAELTERYPQVDWIDVGRKNVKFVMISGKVGVSFLEELDRLLYVSAKNDDSPDVIIINPFMAFLGGPVTDGGYVTPFLRGGDINHQHTDGLQVILERHHVAALIFHHTPKPPTEKEVDGWLKSMFPEYQGAGSSDITNWGRSFITMMKVKGHPRCVCLVAGKNGSELGWEEINGSRRRYMLYSDGESVTGGGRHAWRDLTVDEYDEIVGKDKETADEAISLLVEKIVAQLKETALNFDSLDKKITGIASRRLLRLAIAKIKASPAKYRLMTKDVLIGRKWTKFIGQREGIDKAIKLFSENAKVEEIKRERDENGIETVIPF